MDGSLPRRRSPSRCCTCTWLQGDLFGACLNRDEPFIDALRSSINFWPEPEHAAQHHVSFLRYIDANRASWIVMRPRPPASAVRAQVRGGARKQTSNWWPSCGPAPAATSRNRDEVALVGAMRQPPGRYR